MTILRPFLILLLVLALLPVGGYLRAMDRAADGAGVVSLSEGTDAVRPKVAPTLRAVSARQCRTALVPGGSCAAPALLVETADWPERVLGDHERPASRRTAEGLAHVPPRAPPRRA
ncbi:hypothetical protein [Litorisediminicola beolgyonensis]|uniref:Uncharacterized protein n=1 Tax=Litorisediminicola beolgyonensis TaxID=1173614 RepID=A0ABW3ZGB2_9RHOB